MSHGNSQNLGIHQNLVNMNYFYIYIYIYNKVGVIKLRTLRWEDYPRLSWWASIIIRIFIRGRWEVREEGRCYSTDFEDERRDCESKNGGSP